MRVPSKRQRSSFWIVYVIILAIIVLVLTSPVTRVFGDNPTAIAPDTGTTVSDYTFELLANDTYINFGSNFYADELFIFDNHVNFTNIALGSASNPTQTFGVGMESGNATNSEINEGSVKLTLDCTTGQECHALYYYPSSVIVHAVEVNVAGNIKSFTSYHAAETEFNNALAPAILNSGQTIEVKVTYQDPTTITFYLQTGGIPSGGGVISPPPITEQPPSSATVGPLKVTIPVFNAQPGVPVTEDITVEWSGSWFATLESITFLENPEWFTIGADLPLSNRVNVAPGQVGTTTVIFTVPITVNVPACGTDSVDVEVTATNGISSSMARVDLQIECSQLVDFETIMLLAGAAVGAVGIAAFVKKRRR